MSGTDVVPSDVPDRPKVGRSVPGSVPEPATHSQMQMHPDQIQYSGSIQSECARIEGLSPYTPQLNSHAALPLLKLRNSLPREF